MNQTLAYYTGLRKKKKSLQTTIDSMAIECQGMSNNSIYIGYFQLFACSVHDGLTVQVCH